MIHVTEILKPFANLEFVKPEILEEKARIGTEVHEICAKIARGNIPPPGIIIGYIESFYNWFESCVEEVVLVEQFIESIELGVCGTPDLVVVLKGDTACTLIDIKTPYNAQKTWRLQLAAYAQLCAKAGFAIDRAGSLRLRQDGKKALFTESMQLTYDAYVFNCILDANKFFKD